MRTWHEEMKVTAVKLGLVGERSPLDQACNWRRLPWCKNVVDRILKSYVEEEKSWICALYGKEVCGRIADNYFSNLVQEMGCNSNFHTAASFPRCKHIDRYERQNFDRELSTLSQVIEGSHWGLVIGWVEWGPQASLTSPSVMIVSKLKTAWWSYGKLRYLVYRIFLSV